LRTVQRQIGLSVAFRWSDSAKLVRYFVSGYHDGGHHPLAGLRITSLWPSAPELLAAARRAPYRPAHPHRHHPAFEAIVATLPLGSVGYENAVNERGERLIWLEPKFVDRLGALRGPGESYSDVILRMAKAG